MTDVALVMLGPPLEAMSSNGKKFVQISLIFQIRFSSDKMPDTHDMSTPSMLWAISKFHAIWGSIDQNISYYGASSGNSCYWGNIELNSMLIGIQDSPCYLGFNIEVLEY